MHYTAVIEIHRVEKENPAGVRGVDKDKQEIGRVVLRAKTPEDLRRMCQMGIDTMLYSESEPDEKTTQRLIETQRSFRAYLRDSELSVIESLLSLEESLTSLEKLADRERGNVVSKPCMHSLSGDEDGNCTHGPLPRS